MSSTYEVPGTLQWVPRLRYLQQSFSYFNGHSCHLAMMLQCRFLGPGCRGLNLHFKQLPDDAEADTGEQVDEFLSFL